MASAAAASSLSDSAAPIGAEEALRAALSSKQPTDLLVKAHLAALLSLRDRYPKPDGLHELLRDWSVPLADQALWEELSSVKVAGDVGQQAIKKRIR